MYSYIFGCNDVALKVESNSEKLVKDLVDLYGNYYDDEGITPVTTIRYLENDVPDNYMFRDREDENESYNYLGFDKKTNTLSVSFDGNYDVQKLQFMQRIMCNVFIMEFQRNGYSIVHGACVAKDGKSFIISGNKGAGKTTTLLKLLEQGYDFISNDKVAVKMDNDGVITCGIPHSMGVIKEDIDEFNIDKSLGRYDGPKIYFRVADLGKALNVGVYNKAHLVSMIFPRYEKGREEIDVSSCTNNLLQLGTDNVFKEDAVASQKSYLLEMMEPIEYIDAICINSVSGNLVRQGENTFEQLGSFMDSKLKGEDSKCLH